MPLSHNTSHAPYSQHPARGGLRAAVLRLVREEPLDRRRSDGQIARRLNVSYQAVQHAREALGLPAARARQSLSIDAGLARCAQCLGRTYEVPENAPGIYCPAGHGYLTLSAVRLRFF